MNVNRYNISYPILIRERIPEVIRKPIICALVICFATPIIYVYNNLKTFRDLVIYKLTITPQVVYLEKMLNDRYDAAERRIYIADAKQYTALFLFTKNELKRHFLFKKSEAGFLKTFLYRKNETGQFTYDFVVHVPVVVSFDQNELVALVSTYKLPSMDFKIQIH